MEDFAKSIICLSGSSKSLIFECVFLWKKSFEVAIHGTILSLGG